MTPWRHVMHQRTSACQISFRHAPNRVITGKTFGAHELPGPGPFGNLTVREAVVAVAVPDPKWKEKRAWAGSISALKGACSTTHNDCRLKVEPLQSLARNKRYSRDIYIQKNKNQKYQSWPQQENYLHFFGLSRPGPVPVNSLNPFFLHANRTSSTVTWGAVYTNLGPVIAGVYAIRFSSRLRPAHYACHKGPAWQAMITKI